MAQTDEKDREDNRHQNRLQDHPRHAEKSLSVANLQISPDQEVQQLAMTPGVGQLWENLRRTRVYLDKRRA